VCVCIPAKIKYSPTPMMKQANMTALRGLLYLGLAFRV